MDGHLLLRANVPATAMARSHGQRTSRPVPLTWDLPLAFRRPAPGEAALVARIRHVATAPLDIYHFDGALWARYEKIPDVSSLRDAVAGRPHKGQARIDFPHEASIPDWSLFRQVDDDGRAAAARKAMEVSSGLAIIGNMVVARQKAPVLLTQGRVNQKLTIERTLASPLRSFMPFSPGMRFDLPDAATADSAVSLLERFTGVGSPGSATGNWMVEILHPGMLVSEDLLSGDLAGCVTCLGTSAAFASMDDGTMDKWLAAREKVDRGLAEGDAVPVAWALADFATALVEERPDAPSPALQDLTVGAALAASMAAVRLAVAPETTDADRATLLSIPDRFQWSASLA